MSRLVRPAALALAVFALGAFPAAARANGSYTHVHISQLAWRMLPSGPVRELLDDPEMQHACEAGSLFPDSGYAVEEPYGELAHWEPFVVAYLEDLRARYGGDASSPAARAEIAFLLGVASHGMADQTYDTTLLARAFEVDGPEDEGFGVDQYADYFIVVDHDVRFTVAAWAPYTALSALIERAQGHPLAEARLVEAMGLMESLTRAQSSPLVADNLYWDSWEHYPWLGTYVYDARAVGSLPWIASLVTEQWRVLWQRSMGTDDPGTDLVLRTVPADGQENWPVSVADSESLGRIGIWFGYGVIREDVRPYLTLLGPDGAAVPVSHHTAYGSRDGNVVFLAPVSPLAFDTTYTISVAEGMPTLDGHRATRAFLSSFRTRCDDAHAADCPPLPPALETGPIPVRPARADGGPARTDAGSAHDAGGSVDAAPDAGDASGGPDGLDTGPAAGPDGGCSSVGRASPGSAGACLLLFASVLARAFGRRRRDAVG